jgi:hypothetical protein
MLFLTDIYRHISKRYTYTTSLALPTEVTYIDMDAQTYFLRISSQINPLKTKSFI